MGMQRINSDHTDSDKSHEHMGVLHIANPIAAVMENINIRMLVNGLSREGKENALADLQRTRMAQEEVIQRVRLLQQEDPALFPVQGVQDAIDLVRENWSTNPRNANQPT